MSEFRVTKKSPEFCHVADRFAGCLLTTADAARMLEISRWSVRWLAREGQLSYQRTRSGVRLFWEGEVQRLVARRAAARLRRVTAFRPKLLTFSGQPRQLSLFGARTRLTILRRAPK